MILEIVAFLDASGVVLSARLTGGWRLLTDAEAILSIKSRDESAEFGPAVCGAESGIDILSSYVYAERSSKEKR